MLRRACGKEGLKQGGSQYDLAKRLKERHLDEHKARPQKKQKVRAHEFVEGDYSTYTEDELDDALKAKNLQVGKRGVVDIDTKIYRLEHPETAPPARVVQKKGGKKGKGASVKKPDPYRKAGGISMAGQHPSNSKPEPTDEEKAREKRRLTLCAASGVHATTIKGALRAAEALSSDVVPVAAQGGVAATEGALVVTISVSVIKTRTTRSVKTSGVRISSDPNGAVRNTIVSGLPHHLVHDPEETARLLETIGGAFACVNATDAADDESLTSFRTANCEVTFLHTTAGAEKYFRKEARRSGSGGSGRADEGEEDDTNEAELDDFRAAEEGDY